MNNQNQIIIFTDGSSRGNPGPGGWGSVVVGGGNWGLGVEKGNISDDQVWVTELGGREELTTNNRMELMAAAEGLAHVAEDSHVLVYTDSSYVINGITKWVAGWKRNGWLTKVKGSVLNKDLWMRLDELTSSRRVKWKYVGGHVGIVGNERCDLIATNFADGKQVSLYSGHLSRYDVPNILDTSHDTALVSSKKSSSSRSSAKAYSYVSKVGGEVKIHSTWSDCEKRVKGVKGARFKKALSAAEEAGLRREFGGK